MPPPTPTEQAPHFRYRRLGRLRAWYLGLSIERKAQLITTSVLCAVACALIAGSVEVLRRSFDRLERASIHRTVERIETAMALNCDQLARLTRDYGSWNDTYEFVVDRNERYTTSIFAPTSLANLNLVAFLIFDKEGCLVFGREAAADGTFTEPGSLVGSLGQVARATAAGDGTTHKGYFVKDGVLTYFASQPVLREDHSGPPRGAVIQMRAYDDTALRELQALASVPLVLRRSAVAPERTGAATERSNRAESIEPWPGAGERYSWETTGFDAILLRLPLHDYRNDPVFVLEGTVERMVFQEGVRAITLQVIGIGAITLAAAYLIARLLRALVLRRLAALDDGVRRISESKHLDLETRLGVDGDDEIARLTHQINRLLEALAAAERIRSSDARERELLNTQLQQAQKMEAVGTMAGGIAHDFNNFLCSILGSAELLRQEPALSEEGQALVRRIEKAGGSATNLIRQLLTFGRRQNSAQQPLRLGDAVQDLLNLARTCIPDTIELRCVRLTQDDWILGDATQLQQVVMNLATNASHAMAGAVRGQFVVSIDTAVIPDRERPETAALPAGRCVRIRFSDTGGGIPPEALPRIFEPFFTTKPVGSGSGLGLSVVHGIVLRHRGSIAVERTSPAGTTFVAHFPCVQAPRDDADAPQVPAAYGAPRSGGDRGPKAILLVDDDRLVRDVLAAGLRRRGHHVLTACGGEEALRILKDSSKPLDALITDQMMPGLTGIELGCHARTLRPALRMLLISGYTDVLDPASLRNKGFGGLLGKPVTIEKLESALMRD